MGDSCVVAKTDCLETRTPCLVTRTGARSRTSSRVPGAGMDTKTDCADKRILRIPAHRTRHPDPIECVHSLLFSPFFLPVSSLPFRFSGGDLATRRFL